MLGTLLLFSIGATVLGLIAWAVTCFAHSPEGYEDERGFPLEQRDLPNLDRDLTATPEPTADSRTSHSVEP